MGQHTAFPPVPLAARSKA